MPEKTATIDHRGNQEAGVFVRTLVEPQVLDAGPPDIGVVAAGAHKNELARRPGQCKLQLRSRRRAQEAVERAAVDDETNLGTVDLRLDVGIPPGPPGFLKKLMLSGDFGIDRGRFLDL